MKILTNNWCKRCSGDSLLSSVSFLILFFTLAGASCSGEDDGGTVEDTTEEMTDTTEEDDQENPDTTGNDNVDDLPADVLLPDIDLSNWKVTLPVGNPTEVEPPAILSYGTNETLLPYMYNDSTDGSLVFYAFPGATTRNTSYSRCELREQMEAGSNSVNWTFPEGGKMKGTLQLDSISKDSDGDYHRTIIMQIHGRLTNDQRDEIGEFDNDAPPVLKIYWEDEKVRVKTKVLKDPETTGTDVLVKDNWEDDEGHYFEEEVGFEPFTLEVIASDGRLEIILNDDESVVYDDENMEKWSVFENYFKAGNYLQTLDDDGEARVKYFDLVVTH